MMRQPDGAGLRFDDRQAYRVWAAAQPSGRFEREQGVVVVMASERVNHTRLKANAWLALHRAVEANPGDCEALMDGITVEIGNHTDYEPDAVVNCGERIQGNAIAAPNPVIVVEVLSPSTSYRDSHAKLIDYFSVPSIQHYLIVSADRVRIVHHRRWQEGKLLTAIVTEGTIELDPPGLTIAMADIYRGADFDGPASAK